MHHTLSSETIFIRISSTGIAAAYFGKAKKWSKSAIKCNWNLSCCIVMKCSCRCCCAAIRYKLVVLEKKTISRIVVVLCCFMPLIRMFICSTYFAAPNMGHWLLFLFLYSTADRFYISDFSCAVKMAGWVALALELLFLDISVQQPGFYFTYRYFGEKFLIVKSDNW